MLAHKAEHEGVICVEAIKGLHPHPMDKRLIPGCTYCSPQIASVGLTEQAANAQKLDVRVGRFPFVGNGKAIALGEDQGLVKVIFDKKTGALLGAHMVGADVTGLPVHPAWSPVPSAAYQAPNQCFTDEGYGRYTSCEQGGF